MKAVELDGREVVVCNCDGVFYAVDRRCGHMSSPLEQGTLEGTLLTCAMHCAQFDVVTGEALAGPVPAHLGGEVPGPLTGAMLGNVARLMRNIRTERIRTYSVRVEADWVWVSLSPGPRTP
jgi:nitrite reductase/ring-hydroxylating ferredoxin subunit